ncbi:MAG: hypothetical protein ONA69_01225 [candidate division KSB1 bacterium]|nr:hypothetical protein [candidate division KSB1 bacterium]
MIRNGKRYRFRDLVFWARQGIICIENVQTGEFHTLMVRDFAARAQALLRASEFMPPQERKEHQDFVENAIKACREAQAQGRPDDPKARGYIARHYQQYLPEGYKMLVGAERSKEEHESTPAEEDNTKVDAVKEESQKEESQKEESQEASSK